MEESEQALYAYRAKYGLFDVSDRLSVATQQLTSLNAELVKADMRQADARSRYQQVPPF